MTSQKKLKERQKLDIENKTGYNLFDIFPRNCFYVMLIIFC